jgi:hypothetical protein
MQARTGGVNAYLVCWSTSERRGGSKRIAALMPSSGMVFVKENNGSASEDLAWSSLLADVLEHDQLRLCRWCAVGRAGW